MVDKPDPTGIGMTEKIFTGPLNRQLRDALSYIKNYIIKEKVIKISNQAEAVRIFNFAVCGGRGKSVQCCLSQVLPNWRTDHGYGHAGAYGNHQPAGAGPDDQQ